MNSKDILTMGPVIPVMVIDDLHDAIPLARALVLGGVRVLEITLRTPIALEAIRHIAEAVEGAVVGAGTVLNPRQLDQAQAAGAAFAISPGLTPSLLRSATDSPIPLIPGVATLSEIMQGLDGGLSAFKFFPAAAAGGIPMLKAFEGPLPGVIFCPTGGISPENYRSYLSLSNVACVGGSWLAPRELVKAKDWSAITQLAQAASA